MCIMADSSDPYILKKRGVKSNLRKLEVLQVLGYDTSKKRYNSKGVIEMSITIDLSPADIEFVQAQAAAGNVSVEEFSREAIMKAARNASYLAKLDRAFKQSVEGRCTPHELIAAD